MEKSLQKSLTSQPWDIDCILDILCQQDENMVDKIRNSLQVYKTDTLIFDDPYYDGTKWTTKKFYATGTAAGNTININRNKSCEEAAVIIYHEVWHTQQDCQQLDTFEKREYDAYYYTEQWTIERGLPSQATGFREIDATGQTVASWKGIVELVQKHYPVPSKTIPKSLPRPVGKTREGNTILSDGTIRPPHLGDTFPASKPTHSPNPEIILAEHWQCHG